jgi:hypothetical protein
MLTQSKKTKKLLGFGRGAFSTDLKNELGFSNHRNKRLIFFSFFKNYCTRNQCEKRMIFSHAHISTWVMFCAALANDNVAANYFLATKSFDT